MTITPATRRKRGLRSSEDGATAVEAALVLSVFVGVILTIVDFAQALYIWNTLQLVVGQTSRNMIVQNGVPGGSGCDTTCAKTALQTAIERYLKSTASICTTPTPGQYCVNATCNPSSCSSTASTPTPTMNLSALYGFDFVHTYTLAGQITVPIGRFND
jgi:Flp pilus assembly protein TadG